jgi:hypothetical protein
MGRRGSSPGAHRAAGRGADERSLVLRHSCATCQEEANRCPREIFFMTHLCLPAKIRSKFLPKVVQGSGEVKNIFGRFLALFYAVYRTRNQVNKLNKPTD